MDLQSDKKAHDEIARLIIDKFKLKITPEELLKNFFEYEPVTEKWISARKRFRNAVEKVINRKLTDEEVYLINFWYYRMHRLYCRIYEGVPDVLKFVKSKGFHLGIISNIDDEFLFLELDRHGILEFFDTIVTSEGFGISKPDKRIFEEALRRAEVKPEEALYVGDMEEYDMKPAKEMGFTTVMIGKGESKYADYKVEKFQDLLPLFQKLLQ